MRRAVLVFAIVAACCARESDLASVPRTAVAAAKQEIDRGAVVVIDVRDADAYARGHIPGALHIPLAQISARAGELPRNQPVLTYCT